MPFDSIPDKIDIEYVPITSTLTKIRVHNKTIFPIPQREIICYPITCVTKPLDLFAPFPKQSQTFIPLTPPQPPNRCSSKQSSALKILSGVPCVTSNIIAPKPVIDTATLTLRESRLPTSIRSRSTGSLTTSFSSLKEEKNYANHSRIATQYTQRVSSLSPVSRKIEKKRKSSASPIAFGRSISKERTFAEEKKKMEERLPLCRKSWTASTNILRNPFVKSPSQVKQAVRSTYTQPSSKERFSASSSTRRLQNGRTIKTSALNYASDRLSKNSLKNDEKSLRMTTVASERCSRNGVRTPIVFKSNLTKSSRSTETKFIPKTKQLRKTSSNVSLARTSSTYSIDSTNSKRHTKPITIKSLSKAVAPTTISNKSRKKKSENKYGEIVKANKSHSKSSKQHSEVIHYSPTRSYHGSTSVKDDYKECVNTAIRDSNHSVRSEKFFQHLFLRGLSPELPSKTLYQNTAVQEKAHFYNTIPRRSSGVNKQNKSVYLEQKQAVTSSKFKELENESVRQSQSLSPRRALAPKSIFYNHLSKYDSYYQLSDEEEEFGSTSLNYCYEERSKSEPRTISFINKASETEKNVAERPFSPTKEIRSPSSRRIQSFRSQSTSEAKTIVPLRAQSLYIPNRRYHSLDSRLKSRSTCSINTENYENHLDCCSHRRSERFRDLNKFYSNVERVGQLERATSNNDLHPIRKECELIDFDVWKQVRNHERAERELNHLVGKLREDEKEKDFLFRPKYVEDVKWDQNFDRGLRVKEKSVEDLKEILIEKSFQSELDDLKREEIEASKDTYKPFWRGNSVLDLASSMVVKYNPTTPKIKRNQSLREAQERRFGLSRDLISTLSKDQVNKIKNQLSEIYSNNLKNDQKQEIAEDFIINVTKEHTVRPSSLVVRSNSLLGQKDLLKPVLLRQHERLTNSFKSESIGSVHDSRVSRSADRYDSIVRKQQKAYTEDEKKKLLQLLGNEIREKINERRQKVLQPRETRGAIASEQSTISLSKDQPNASTSFSVEYSDKQSINHKSPQSKLTYEAKAEAKYNKSFETKHQPFSYIHHQAKATTSSCDTDTASSELSKQTVIFVEPIDKIKKKIVYFECKKDEEPAKTIYHARDDSSPDEEEIIRLVEKNVKARRTAQQERTRFSSNGLSTSVTDFKEIFGENECNRNLIEFRSPSPDTDVQSKNALNATSIESFFRSRSISPICNSKHSILKQRTKSGNKEQIIHKYESATYKPPRIRSIYVPPRRFKSDPDLNVVNRNRSPTKITIKNHEAGDVSWITHKFERKNSGISRGRSRTRKVISPIQKVSFKKEDRFMPHIDIISKTAELKQEIYRRSPVRKHFTTAVCTGEVEKIRHKFESHSPDRLSLIGQMYTSSPDISELKDISGYLSGNWIAHQYPKPLDNARSASASEKSPHKQAIKRKPTSRSRSSSPPRTTDFSSILKPFYDIFADQDFDPLKHRPINRYVPDKRIEAEFLWRRLKRTNGYNWKPSVKFQGWNIIAFNFLSSQCTKSQ